MQESQGKVVFYTKCRPQKADAWPIAEKAKYAFVGYPLHRKASTEVRRQWRDNGIGTLFVDPTDPDWATLAREVTSGYSRQVSANRNLANSITPGSFVIVPRPRDGICYIGTVSRFQLARNPAWADEYLALRRKAGLECKNELSHVGDVIQGWPVKQWEEVQFLTLPRWISYRLLSRNTAGIIRDLGEPPVSAHQVIGDLLSCPAGSRYRPLRDEEDTGRALLDWLSPTAFEHLVVALLQLEDSNQWYWHHVGGSGDGGIDGIAVSADGKRHAVLQCKWHYGKSPKVLADSLQKPGEKVFVAILHGHQSTPGEFEGGVFLNRERIAQLVRKHRDRLPFAKSIGLR